MSTDSLLERLEVLDSCSVSDALDAHGLTGVIAGVTPLTAGARACGRIVTIELGPADGSSADRHLCTAAIEHADAGSILLVDHQGRSDCAGWGGNLSRAALHRGLRATVVVGAARDVDESQVIGYPVFASSVTPTTARNRAREVRWGEPVTVAGVVAKTGDILVADGSGVVVVPIEHLEAVLQTAETIVAKERLIAQSIAEGTPAGTAMGANYETMLGARA